MGRGVGMATALRNATGRIVRADAVDSSAAPFSCAGCGAPVERVSGYWIHKEDPDLAREVQAFFRLKRGEDYQHAEDCTYTPAGQVRVLVAEAEAVEHSINPFERRRLVGPVVFRLNIPAEEERRERAAEPPEQKADFKARIERIWSGRRLEAYCRSAVGLAKLWQMLEGPEAQAELRKHVRLDHAGRQLPWTDFFFPPQDMARFADKVERGELRYPAALLLHVRPRRRGVTGRSAVTFTPVPDRHASAETRIAVEAYGEDRVLNLFDAGQHYIVFGSFWHRGNRSWTSDDGAVTINYRNFAVKLFRPSQMAPVEVVNPTGETDASP